MPATSPSMARLTGPRFSSQVLKSCLPIYRNSWKTRMRTPRLGYTCNIGGSGGRIPEVGQNNPMWCMKLLTCLMQLIGYITLGWNIDGKY